MMGVELSLTAILYSPLACLLWLVGVAGYTLFHLREVKLEPYSVGLLLLTMWSFAVAVFYNSWVSMAATVVLACFFLFHQWIISRVWQEEELDRLFRRLFHLGTGTALIGWLQQMDQWPAAANVFTRMMGWVPLVPISEDRISGTFSNPNFAASWYAVLLILGLWMWERASRAGKRLIVAEMIVLMGALYFTGSRGGFMAWLAGTGCYLLVRYRRQAWFGVGGMAALLLTVGFFRPEWLPRGHLFWQSLETRLDIWRSGLDLFLSRPVTGIGLANMWFLPPWETGYPVPLPHAHNTLLSVAVELGLIGLVLFVWMQVFVWKGLYQLTAAGRPHAPVLAGAMAALMAHGLVDHPLFLPQVALIYFGVSGLVLSLAPAVSTTGQLAPDLVRFWKNSHRSATFHSSITHR
ncbi:MAG: hypothetical protein A6D91_01920 [Bacillaceae bacterium G1]|nr:hypothetical protein [Bacillota bacterium]OJF18393.1 MAG: hypothetical protein A6D91_01920 [Bacillaceae bacterium G1]